EQSVALVHENPELAQLDPHFQTYQALANLRLMQARPEDALNITTQLAARLGQPGPHYHKAGLGRANTTAGEAHAYLGRFDQARQHFEQAHHNFIEAGDQAGLLHNHVVWATEYFGQQGEWEPARQQLERAQTLSRTGEKTAPVDKVRLHLGLAQLSLQASTHQQTGAHLAQAQELIESKGIFWWRAPFDYYRGMWLAAQGQFSEARGVYLHGLTAVAEGSNPDYLPLLLLNLADIAETTTAEREYLARCLQTAHKRARHLDRLHCFQVARALGKSK
ncbi:MAG: hypothetical protein KDD89_08655, partial [Anaerolineales bacterium]|nr:hypothetical protein [Anaerolineales bacterium]